MNPLKAVPEVGRERYRDGNDGSRLAHLKLGVRWRSWAGTGWSWMGKHGMTDADCEEKQVAIRQRHKDVMKRCVWFA